MMVNDFICRKVLMAQIDNICAGIKFPGTSSIQVWTAEYLRWCFKVTIVLLQKFKEIFALLSLLMHSSWTKRGKTTSKERYSHNFHSCACD